MNENVRPADRNANTNGIDLQLIEQRQNQSRKEKVHLVRPSISRLMNEYDLAFRVQVALILVLLFPLLMFFSEESMSSRLFAELIPN